MQRTRGDHRGASQMDMGSSQCQSRHSWGERPGNGTLLGCCSGTGFLSRPWLAIIIREPPYSLTARLIFTCAMVWIKNTCPSAPKKACTAVHPLCSHCLRMFHLRSYTLKPYVLHSHGQDITNRGCSCTIQDRWRELSSKRVRSDHQHRRQRQRWKQWVAKQHWF